MLITKTSQLTGKTHTLDIPVTNEELMYWEKSGTTIQSALPNLSPSEREFLITGSTDEEWNATFAR